MKALSFTLWLLPIAAVAQPDAERDAEIFGEPGSEGESNRKGESDAPPDAGFGSDEEGRDESIFGDETSTSDLERAFEQGLDATEDWLDIGGLLYMRLQYSAQEQVAAEESPLSSPNLVDVYFDARPNDRVRAYMRGRLAHDFTIPEGAIDAFGQPREQTAVLLDQLWLKADILQTVYLTIGKQPIRWGSGRFWNPTDFLNRQRRDPLAIIDERPGVSMVKLHLPIESLGWNLYAVANLDEAETLELAGGAVRAEVLFGETELALTYATRKNNPHQVGFDISSAIWLFDLRAELAALHGVETPFYRGPFDVDLLLLQRPDPVMRDDEWILQGSAALEITVRYSDQDTVTLGAEYFYNDAGYKNAHLYPWLAFNNQFVPRYVGRHYAGAYVYLPQPGLWNDTSFTLSALGNLSDESYLGRLDYQVRLLTHLDLNVYATYAFGQNGELNYGVDLDLRQLKRDLEVLQRLGVEGLEGFEDLPDRLFQPQPIFSVGLALRLAF